MSFLVKIETPFINFKLTEAGREKLALGALNFSYWSVGDSEIDYQREYDYNNGLSIDQTSMILRPKDKQPNSKYYVSTGDAVLKTLTDTRTVKTVINNKAETKGFFSGNTNNFTTLTGIGYTKSNGVISSTSFTGAKTLPVTGATIGDFILIKLTNIITGNISGATSNSTPIPYLWYKVVGENSGTITVDRNLPTLVSGVNVPYFLYDSGSLANDLPSNSAKWDSGSLSFYLDGLDDNYPTWRMNNVWEENIVGVIGANIADYKRFGSHNYMGEKKYLGLSLSDTVTSGSTAIVCDGSTSNDTGNKAISIIHFTNNSITNQYGEYLYVSGTDNKIFKLHLPTIMYHRKTDASELGMTFIATGNTSLITGTNIQYIDLIEDPSLVYGKTPKIVGKVYPQLSISVIHDEEIVATMSYKSNRNWTLPRLEGKLKSSEAGTTGGVLDPNKTMYLTYSIDNTNGVGITKALPCQEYVKITNNTTTSKDVEFILEDIGLLKYMGKTESVGYDGTGFYGNEFNLIYQIVDSPDTRPLSDKWLKADFTSDKITGLVTETIDPALLERQNSTLNGFILTKAIHVSNMSNYLNISTDLGIPNINDTEQFNFGCENIFYGNIETYIGATVYKTVFNINLPNGDYVTTNPSKIGVTTPIKISEIGIYDSTQSLIGIAKLSDAIELNGNPITIEVGMDF